MYYSNEAPSRRPNLMGYSWWPDFNDPYDECYIILDSAEAGAAGANGNYYHNTAVDALLAQMKNADRETLTRDAYTLQDITGHLDPPAIWTAEPAQVTILAKNVRGFVYNPIELRTYGFYTMYRAA